MYIDVVPNRKSPPAVLLRQSRRDGGKIVKTTLANLSQCPPEAVAALRLALRGVALVPHEEVFAVERSIPHGHVQAVLGVMRTVGMDALLAARPCRERALVLAMIAQRLLDPCSKLATTRVWHTTTLAQELGVADADANDLYAALDWLQQRQGRIEKKLAACPLARRGYNRDGDKLPSIVYGLLTDGAGRPIAVDVYPGNTGDPSTVPDQVEKLRMRFRLQRVVLVGDRGMLTHTQINALRGHPGVGWISALRFPAIRALAEHGAFQPSLFDTPHLAEITSDAYPGERLVVCYNPALAADRARTRDELLAATEARLARIAAAVARRTKTPSDRRRDRREGRENHQPLQRRQTLRCDHRGRAVALRAQRRLHRTRGPARRHLHPPHQRTRGRGERRRRRPHLQESRARRAGLPLHERHRPARAAHPASQRRACARAHALVHARLLRRTPAARRLVDRPLQDDDLDAARWTRDPVARAEPSESARAKKRTKTTDDGWPGQSLRTVLSALGTRCKNTCRAATGKNVLRFEQLTETSPFQQHVFSLLGLTP